MIVGETKCSNVKMFQLTIQQQNGMAITKAVLRQTEVLPTPCNLPAMPQAKALCVAEALQLSGSSLKKSSSFFGEIFVSPFFPILNTLN